MRNGHRHPVTRIIARGPVRPVAELAFAIFTALAAPRVAAPFVLHSASHQIPGGSQSPVTSRAEGCTVTPAAAASRVRAVLIRTPRDLSGDQAVDVAPRVRVGLAARARSQSPSTKA